MGDSLPHEFEELRGVFIRPDAEASHATDHVERLIHGVEEFLSIKSSAWGISDSPRGFRIIREKFVHLLGIEKLVKYRGFR